VRQRGGGRTTNQSRSSRRSRNTRSERTALADAHGRLKDVERWFIKRGLPHFIEDYRATDDVFSRALPLVVLLIVFQMGLELTSKTVTWKDRGIGAGIGVGAVLVILLVANLVRQPAHWYKMPRKVGFVEIILLVVLGPVVGLMTRARDGAVALDFVANIAAFLVVWALVSYAVLPVILWAFKHTLSELGNLVNLASKALPMLALFGTFLFLNVDMWHIAANLPRNRLWLVVGFFAVITFLFLMVRLPDEVRRLRGGYTLDSVRAAAESTPLEAHLDDLDEVLPQIAPSRRQRINMLFVLGFTQIIQVLLLSLVVFVYFICLGKLAVSRDQMVDWVKPEDDAVFQKLIAKPGKFFGFDAQIPWTHIRFPESLIQTAILITTFSAFFFAVSAVTDEAYRKDFFESITGKLTRSLEIRCGYVHLYVKAIKRIEDAREAWDPAAVIADHERTMQVPLFVATPEAETVPVENFQPRPPSWEQPGGAAHESAAVDNTDENEDPFRRWPQKQ
jgi:hypothetical protein